MRFNGCRRQTLRLLRQNQELLGTSRRRPVLSRDCTKLNVTSTLNFSLLLTCVSSWKCYLQQERTRLQCVLLVCWENRHILPRRIWPSAASNATILGPNRETDEGDFIDLVLSESGAFLQRNAADQYNYLRDPFILQQKVPQYAILSHCWGDDEVSLQDLRAGVHHKAGFKKIADVCQLAREEYYLKWAWVDTCCIDKESSAELSESINSMYKWYQESKVCYVFLPDVEVKPAGWLQEFTGSRYWTRGWTLQELLAPRNVRFFSKKLEFIGDRRRIAKTISTISKIPLELLQGGSDQAQRLSRTSIACRMSWASKRQTTREEDMAYCLLGIFNVNMPLLYGEGPKAFQRLQEAIVSTTTDETIFAWISSETNPSEKTKGGLLASSPRDFAHSSNIISITTTSRPPTTVTNNGIQIHYAITDPMDLIRYAIHWLIRNSASSEPIHLDLNCMNKIPGEPPQWITIPLESRNTFDGVYCRTHRHNLLQRRLNISVVPRFYAKIYVSPHQDDPKAESQLQTLLTGYLNHRWLRPLQAALFLRRRLEWAAVLLSFLYLPSNPYKVPPDNVYMQWVIWAFAILSLFDNFEGAMDIFQRTNWQSWKSLWWLYWVKFGSLPVNIIAASALLASVVNLFLPYRPLRSDESESISTENSV